MSRRSYRGTPFIIFIALILVFSGVLFIPGNVNSVVLDKFANGNKIVEISYDGSFIDGTSVAIEIPVNASILDASLNVTGFINNGYYPTDVTVNIGNDEDIDWAFMGTGYGSFGRQKLFSNGDPKKHLKFHETSFNNSAHIILPRNATVTSTSMSLEGGTTYDEDYFVAVDVYGNKLSYIQSNGDGSFKPPASIATTVGSYQWASCSMGDFDNDGDLDVIGTDGRNGNMFLYEKTATGNNFKAGVLVGTIAVSSYVYDFAAGDFTNDGNYDFIVSGNSASIYLFAGNGDGTFVMSTLTASGLPTYAYSKDAADFDNDGNLDLVCGGYRSGRSYECWVYLGNGDGSFQSGLTVSLGSPHYYAYGLMAADFNNDGDADLLAGYYNQYMVFLEGNGDGTFKAGKTTAVKSNIYSYNGGDDWDYNRDGYVDVIVCDSYTSEEAYYFRGRGDGTFDVNGTPLGDIDRCYGGAGPPPRIIGAENVALDVGDLGTGYEWEYTGILEDVVEYVDPTKLKNKLNTCLSWPTLNSFTDEYGNEFVVIPLNLTSTNEGLIRITNLNIDYSYTAKIFKKNNDNIINELNEHIVYTDTETIMIYFIVTSSTGGKLKFSDLKINYNIPPDINNIIDTQYAYEDTENLNLLDLSNYFTDTDEPTKNLNYSVVLNTQAEHVEVFSNFTNILKVRPLTENWFGETEVVVQVIDSGLKKTYSNKFKIKILPVNDEPTTKHQIPDVQLIESGKESTLDLDLREYFTDIEDDYLYYSLAIDPKNLLKDDRKEITAHIEDNHNVVIQSIGDFNTMHNGTNLPVPIWIYCDDDKEVNTLADGPNNYTRQEILVRIQPVNDPPQWSSVPNVYLYEDETETFANCIELYPYLQDDETPVEELILQILSNSNSNIDVSLNKGLISIAAPDNYHGSTTVTLRASEPDPTYRTDTSFKIEIAPVNDAPNIFIHFPLNYADVSGTTELRGSMFDVEGTIQLVEIKIDSRETSENAVHFDWQQAMIFVYKETDTEYNNNWTYSWDTTTVPDGEYKLSARVYDGELMSETYVNVRVDNGQNKEPIVDITTPYEEEMVNGSVLIRGTVTDPDNQGIEELQVRIGRDMDWTDIELRSKNGTVDWYYQWDSTAITDGPIVISAKAFDGLSWSAPVNRKVNVINGIEEEIVKDSGKQDKGGEINWIFLAIIILIVVMIIIGLLAMFLIIRRGKKQIQEFVPDGRIEPLDEVEAKLRPALGPGVSIEHAPALPAASAGVPGATYVTPVLPAAGPMAATPTPTGMPVVPTLPAAAAPAGMGTSLPALPPATGINYGIYSPSPPAQPVLPATPAKYQPAPAAPIPTAQTTTPPGILPAKLTPTSEAEYSNTNQ